MVAQQRLVQAIGLLASAAFALTLGHKKYTVTDVGKRDLLQDLVTFDEHSLFVRGERIMLYSGEFHPWRLPVPRLWLDVFQKIRALEYTVVSFYIDWALHEGDPGHFIAEGVFGYDQFFAAAAEARIYLLARPGPYVNAEVSGGGFPGWLQRNPAILRTNMTEFVEAQSNYVENIGKIIADAQITNGGPVVLFQAENEYTFGTDWVEWPDVEYISGLNQQYRDTGIVVPFVNNEAAVIGLFTPGEPGGPDIYGSDPSNWTAATLPTDWDDLHQEQSPNTPYAIPEFQGGALDSWGGVGLDGCAALIEHEFEKFFYKNDFSFGIKILNLYMTFGGTNWGNLGQPGGYTSYDYGAAIRENRMVDREKYSEAKLEAHLIVSSPAYLDAVPGNQTNTSYVDTTAITTTPVVGERTTFYITRQSDYRSLETTQYKTTMPTSEGNITIPQLGGTLSIQGRDSKIIVSDYDVDGLNLLYSSADILTLSKSGSKRVLILYGGDGETHEFDLPSSVGKPAVEGGDVKIERSGLYLLWRNEAYNYWKLELEAAAPIGNFSAQAKESVIVKAGYLMRSANVSSGALYLVGDVNATTDVELISGYDNRRGSVYFSGQELQHSWSGHGCLQATVQFIQLNVQLPDLSSLDWKYIDSLPEIQESYDDSAWTVASSPSTSPKNYSDTGELFELKTPTSLIAGDYGFTAGSLTYRGHFEATGLKRTLNITTQGGGGSGRSVWLNDVFLASFGGDGRGTSAATYDIISPLAGDEQYVITVLIDHITWRVTGNFGGEQYVDKTRGPLNEGATFAERQGYHLPSPPSSNWGSRSPLDGLEEAGVGFFTAEFSLDLPQGYDIPLSFVFNSSTVAFSSEPSERQVSGTASASQYRVQLFVNGWQFGKFINQLGPQTRFAVPEGILNHRGPNTVAMTLWAQDATGASFSGFELKADAVIASGAARPEVVESPAWAKRDGAY